MSREKNEKSNLEFAERLKVLKGSRTQKEFAEWLDEPVTTINGYFTGASRPNIDFVIKLAEKGVSPLWFLTGEGEIFLSSRKADALAPEIQALLFEIGNDTELALELLHLARSSKNVQQAYSVVAERLAEFKASLRKKKK